MTVLYAEDDENDVFFMRRAFSKLGLRSALHVVSNGRAAVDCLDGTGEFADRARHPLPSLLILDVKMPAMSGLEVLQWTRAQPEFNHLPIVVFTSSTQYADLAFSREHRASAYVVKPANLEQLPVLVHAILDAVAAPRSDNNALDFPQNLLRAS